MDNILFSLGEEIFIAIFGGGITLLVGFTARKYKRWRLEIRYPIEGDYISEFEDVIDGERTSIKAPVHIKQKGRNIEGTTEFDGRTWVLEGEISEDGYMHGIYYAKDIHDRGVGNFFLEIKIDGIMEGLWSGYDSVNKKIVSGRYSFFRKHIVEIKPTTKKQVPAILNIAEKQLGASYINVDDLLHEDCISIFASISGKIVGFCTGKSIPISTLFESLPQLEKRKLKQLQILDSVGTVASVATDPDFSGRGVGSALVEYCVNELEEKGMNVLVMTAWQSEKGVHIGSIAKNHGFQKILEIPDFWEEDSLRNGYKCPSCGTPPCKCSAVIYIRHSLQ